MTTAENDNDDGIEFDFANTDWDDLPGESPVSAEDMLARATAEDPFATSRLVDCDPRHGVTPSALSRYERASAAYLADCHAEEQDDDRQEILRLITAYWLRKSRAFWLD